jgi:hypothetical protein
MAIDDSGTCVYAVVQVLRSLVRAASGQRHNAGTRRRRHPHESYDDIGPVHDVSTAPRTAHLVLAPVSVRVNADGAAVDALFAHRAVVIIVARQSVPSSTASVVIHEAARTPGLGNRPTAPRHRVATVTTEIHCITAPPPRITTSPASISIIQHGNTSTGSTATVARRPAPVKVVFIVLVIVSS